MIQCSAKCILYYYPSSVLWLMQNISLNQLQAFHCYKVKWIILWWRGKGSFIASDETLLEAPKAINNTFFVCTSLQNKEVLPLQWVYKKKALNIELCITLRPWDALNVASVVQYAHYHKTLLLKFYSHTPHCQIALFDAVCFVISNYLQHLHNFMLQLSQSNCISTAAVFCILFSYWKKEKYLELLLLSF